MKVTSPLGHRSQLRTQLSALLDELRLLLTAGLSSLGLFVAARLEVALGTLLALLGGGVAFDYLGLYLDSLSISSLGLLTEMHLTVFIDPAIDLPEGQAGQ